MCVQTNLKNILSRMDKMQKVKARDRQEVAETLTSFKAGQITEQQARAVVKNHLGLLK
jgi:hypothetical protein